MLIRTVLVTSTYYSVVVHWSKLVLILARRRKLATLRTNVPEYWHNAYKQYVYLLSFTCCCYSEVSQQAIGTINSHEVMLYIIGYLIKAHTPSLEIFLAGTHTLMLVSLFIMEYRALLTYCYQGKPDSNTMVVSQTGSPDCTGISLVL